MGRRVQIKRISARRLHRPDILLLIRDNTGQTGPARGVEVGLLGFQFKCHIQDQTHYQAADPRPRPVGDGDRDGRRMCNVATSGIEFLEDDRGSAAGG